MYEWQYASISLADWLDGWRLAGGWLAGWLAAGCESLLEVGYAGCERLGGSALVAVAWDRGARKRSYAGGKGGKWCGA